MTPDAPKVSVVLAVYNDRARVGRAIRSALDQGIESLEVIAVDDGSTDGTDLVLAELASQDPRVCVVTRAESSGFPGVPRNVGLLRASGEYVAFLDSDDELIQGGLVALLEEAERTGVDAVFGRTVRVNPNRGTVTDWMPWLFEERGVSRLVERPELVGDSIVVDRLIRRSATEGLTFPGDILYEDVFFTAALAARLDTVSVTDVSYYRWYVRATNADRSITNSRREAPNYRSRLEASRRATRALKVAGRQDLIVAKDRKALDHDVPLLLRDMRDRDADSRRELLDEVVEFVAELDPAVTGSHLQPGALVLSAVGTGDPDAVADVAALAYRRQLVVPVEVVDRSSRWPGVSGAAGDITSLVEPLVKEGVVVFHEVQSCAVAGDRLELVVTSRSNAGKADVSSVRLLVVDRRRKRRVAVSHRTAVTADEMHAGFTWRGTVRLARGLRRLELLGELDVRVVTSIGGHDVRWVLAVPEGLAQDVTIRARRLGRGRVAEGYQTALGNLSLRRTR